LYDCIFSELNDDYHDLEGGFKCAFFPLNFNFLKSWGVSLLRGNLVNTLGSVFWETLKLREGSNLPPIPLGTQQNHTLGQGGLS
jgi:hypothetical protein